MAGWSVLVAPALASGGPGIRALGADELSPGFAWKTRTYGARCRGGALDIRVHAGHGWRAEAEGRSARRGSLRLRVRLAGGQAASVSFVRRDGRRRRYSIRCLPAGFPEFAFERIRDGGPRLFFVANDGYLAIFDRNGAPVWWLRVEGAGADGKLLPDGTISLNTAAGLVAGEFEIRRLDGRLVRTVGSDESTDLHDLQLLPNGNYVIGTMSFRSGIDASAFGGAPDALVLDIAIEELTPAGDVVRRWDSGEHIGLDETGRWWSEIVTDGALWYDVSHWNAVEVDGRHMYLSFRNTDSIYKVDRRTGAIIWKLGGTETPESLEVRGDPGGGDPLGAQHDVRVQPNGTITVFDNRTGLPDEVPRAKRFRIDERAGTATLVEAIGDRRVTSAFCCGSARRLPSKEWLVSWGNTGVVGAYDRDGRVIYRLLTPPGQGFTYRANPVPAGELEIGELRRAMDRIYGGRRAPAPSDGPAP